MCQEHQVAGYPSIRVFRKGHDEISMCAARASCPVGAALHAAPCSASRRAPAPQDALGSRLLCAYPCLHPYHLKPQVCVILPQCTHAGAV